MWTIMERQSATGGLGAQASAKVKKKNKKNAGRETIRTRKSVSGLNQLANQLKKNFKKSI